MVSPFDLYKGRSFEGLDPDGFNKEAYMEQQRQLFADTFKDQLGQLGQTYQSQLEAARLNQENLNKTSAQLTELTSRTKSLEDNFKNSENNFKSTEAKLNSSKAFLNTFQNQLDAANRAVNIHQNSVNNQQAAMNKISNDIKNRLINSLKRIYREPKLSQVVNQNLNNELARNKTYQNALKAKNEAQVKLNTEKSKAQTFQNKVRDQKNEVAKHEQAFNQARVQLNQANQQLNQHKQQLQQVSQQVNQFSQALGGANKEAEKAMLDAQTIQQKIQNFQARSEPLKQLESQIQGKYEDASKASIEELKKIASNSLDPISQKNAQNLLNQRAEQIAKTYGKNVEDVKKEMMAAVGQLSPEQFSQEQFNKFMGIEAPKIAEIQEEGDLRQDVTPQASISTPQQVQVAPQAPIMPVEEPKSAQPTPQTSTQSQAQTTGAPQMSAIPPSPPQAQPAPQAQAQAVATQQIQQQAQAQTTGAPQAPAPQPTPQTSTQSQAQATGMPNLPTPQPIQQPFGPLNSQIKQGFQRQLQQGFQNAMKIKATPQPQGQQTQPGTQDDALAERRRAVAAQAMGIANRSTSVSKPINQEQVYKKGQNINMGQNQNTLNKNVGRRQLR